MIASFSIEEELSDEGKDYGGLGSSKKERKVSKRGKRKEAKGREEISSKEKTQ